MSKRTRQKLKKLKAEKRKTLLGALSIVFIVLSLVFMPVVRIRMLSGLGFFDKTLIDYGTGTFTLGDVGYILSLVAAACTITLVLRYCMVVVVETERINHIPFPVHQSFFLLVIYLW